MPLKRSPKPTHRKIIFSNFICPLTTRTWLYFSTPIIFIVAAQGALLLADI
jgi:hypothetical protein